MDQASWSTLSRDQLIGELTKCHAEKRKLGEKSSGGGNSVEQLRARCELAESERDRLKGELASMAQEMDELHDNFKEDENEQFEQVKQELDTAIKNCKILQIRLNKSERQYAQLEQVKLMLESQLEEQVINTNSTPNSNRLSGQSHGKNFIQLGPECVKLATAEYDQLLRDLNDTIEREKDLQEQIKYSQEEAQMKSERLQIVETENETLLESVQKLSQANSRLRSQLANRNRNSQSSTESKRESLETADDEIIDRDELIEQNEQLKLAIDLSQGECQRLKKRCQDLSNQLREKDQALSELEVKRSKLETDLVRLRSLKRSTAIDDTSKVASSNETGAEAREEIARLELECRQLRSKLVLSERENKQHRQQNERQSEKEGTRANPRHMQTFGPSRSQSMESKSNEQETRLREINDQLRDECQSLRQRKTELEEIVERTLKDKNNSQNSKGDPDMEADLVVKTRKQLETYEKELARVKSRLVELDLDLGRTQRQHRRLVESIESKAEIQLSRKVQLPTETQRDSMTRQELRQTMKDLEQQVEECKMIIRGLRELNTIRLDEQAIREKDRAQESTEVKGEKANSEKSDDNSRQLLDQERTEGVKLRSQVSDLQVQIENLQRRITMLERERVKVLEETDKLRQINSELRSELEDSNQNKRNLDVKVRDLQATIEKLRIELANSQSQRESRMTKANGDQNDDQPNLLTRDLEELRAKNSFLLRELELAREESTRQVDDLQKANEAKVKRAIELAQLEVRETELSTSQKLRDEIGELKQKLSNLTRLLNRSQEETNAERDKIRATERDWRREKSQWQQKTEQLEAQMTIERRSSSFRVKEFESAIRDKDRELLAMQDKCVQLERDLRRVQSKFGLYEEASESKLKSLTSDLETKKRELNDLVANERRREEEYYDRLKRLTDEKTTLNEALETIKRSYDEKLLELKSVREVLGLRQDQLYRDRLNSQEKIDNLSNQLIRASEHESQAKLLRHQVQVQEKQVDTLRRELVSLKEDRQKLKARYDELERRCQHFEKQELQQKTSSISSHSRGSAFYLAPRSKTPQGGDQTGGKAAVQTSSSTQEGSSMLAKLSAKVNDQRQLINLMKSQLSESQMELKQVKLLHSCERSKWQCQVNELTGRLNEAEERLLFELSLVNQETLEFGRRKLESKWSEERRSAHDLIQQQQTENDNLTRDMKRLSQAHELLRLHCKQVESHNNKLSRKLIEYQQREQMSLSNESQMSGAMRLWAGELETESKRMASLMQEQVRPVVETVNRMLATLDGTSTLSSESARQMNKSTKDEDGPTRSTSRPLMTRTNYQRDSSIDSDNDHSSYMSGALPAHRVNAAHQQRLTRILLNKDPGQGEPSSLKNSPEESKGAKTKIVRRVKLKSASLGLTLAEKRQLKSRLELLAKEIEGLRQPDESNRKPEGVSSGFRLQLNDSDIDSALEIRTPTIIQSAASKRYSCDGSTSVFDYESESSVASDYPLRYQFGQRHNGAESDSCLTSSGHQTAASSSLASDGSVRGKVAKKRSKGLTGRLTSTIRNLSRSLAGMTSDSEAEDNQRGKSLQRSSAIKSDARLKELRV